jgi:predicted deacylase
MSVVFRMEAPYRKDYELHRLSFGSGGPSVAIVAGLHGNELNSMHAVNLLAASLQARRLQGTVHLFPLVNTFGADEGVKRWPFDERDINHAFPGSSDGAGVERIAHALLEHSAADVCVDVHSGAPHVRELPQVRCPLSGRELELARATGLPVIWRRSGEHLDADGLVGAWRREGRTALHMVGGRGITLDTAHSSTLARGLARLLAHLGIIPTVGAGETLAEVTRGEIETHRAPCGGFFVPEVRVGAHVKPGHLLGYLQLPIGGDRIAEIRAEHTGVVMTLRAWPMVHAAELLVRVAVLP